MQQSTFISGPSAYAAMAPSGTPAAFEAIDKLFKEYKEASDGQIKKDKLHAAYSLCLDQIKTGGPALMGRISLILGEYGILLYAQKPMYPGKQFPSDAEFSLSKHVLLGALQALLVRIHANQVEIDFNAPATQDLKRLPEIILDQKPFASVEALFIQADRTALIDLARGANLSDLERLHFSKLLRYLNGAARHILGVYEKREPSEKDNKLTCNALYLAREFARSDDNEFWELMYNDWADVLKAEGHWNEAKKVEHAAWLIQNAGKNDSRIARVNNKFFRDQTGVRKSLDTCLEIFKRKMVPQDYQNLVAVTQGKLLDVSLIEALVKKVYTLDLTGDNHLQLGWFAIIPSNMAFKLMEAHSEDLAQIQGLLCLSKAIVEIERKDGDNSFNFEAVDRNWARLEIYQQQLILKASASLAQVAEILKNPTHSRQEALALLQQAKIAALKAKQVFEQWQSLNDPFGLSAIVQQQQKISDQLLKTIEEAMVNFQQS